MEAAAREETDHLAWTKQRLDELGDRPSLLNPLWYAGAFGIGLLAGRLGDRVSLGFVVETERQVEEHLAGHLDRLPGRRPRLARHRRADEGRRASARRRRSTPARMPTAAPVRWLMRGAAKVMTTTAHRI
jgi:3-demethoxyubiquinol 3-hydroxylase